MTDAEFVCVRGIFLRDVCMFCVALPACHFWHIYSALNNVFKQS